MEEKRIKVLIVAGEASGDTHAAKLVLALREATGGAVEFFGSAGPRMREAGVKAVVKADDLSIVGLLEIGKAIPMFVKTMNKLKKAAREVRPDVVILVDFPDFNLKLAKHFKRKGLKVVYYISPQLWAWREYRIASIKKYVDLLITILPFEKPWYAERDVYNVEYVGSPLVREVTPSTTRDEFRAEHGIDNNVPFVALLPGSRSKEISRILPTMLATAGQMPDVSFAVAVNRSLGTSYKLPPNTICVRDETYNCLTAADAAAVTSGTATLETGIIGTPMAVVYKTSKLNYSLLEPIINVPHYGLINLIAEERLATELIQDDLNADRLKLELESLLDPIRNKEMREKLKAATDKLGRGGASKRAAEAILRVL
jgi:lipid-A-disaccharide synthase